MGKKLIIKGADFSLNAIITDRIIYINDYSDSVLDAPSAFSSSNKFYLKPSEMTRLSLENVSISIVKLYAKTSGNITIGTTNKTTESGVNTYAVQQGVNIVRLVSPITIDSTHLPSFGGINILSLWNDNDPAKGWNFGRVGSSTTYNGYYIPISFGYLVTP